MEAASSGTRRPTWSSISGWSGITDFAACASVSALSRFSPCWHTSKPGCWTQPRHAGRLRPASRSASALPRLCPAPGGSTGRHGLWADRVRLPRGEPVELGNRRVEFLLTQVHARQRAVRLEIRRIDLDGLLQVRFGASQIAGCRPRASGQRQYGAVRRCPVQPPLDACACLAGLAVLEAHRHERHERLEEVGVQTERLLECGASPGAVLPSARDQACLCVNRCNLRVVFQQALGNRSRPFNLPSRQEAASEHQLRTQAARLCLCGLLGQLRRRRQRIALHLHQSQPGLRDCGTWVQLQDLPVRRRRRIEVAARLLYVAKEELRVDEDLGSCQLRPWHRPTRRRACHRRVQGDPGPRGRRQASAPS